MNSRRVSYSIYQMNTHGLQWWCKWGRGVFDFPPRHQTNADRAYRTRRTRRSKQARTNSDICVHRAVSSSDTSLCLYVYASLAHPSITVPYNLSLFLHHHFFASLFQTASLCIPPIPLLFFAVPRAYRRMSEKGAVKIKGARWHASGLVCGR